MRDNEIATLFLDIGGVLLTNGWGHEARNNAMVHFNLDSEEINDRHHLAFNIYEEGKLTLEAYLKLVVFFEPRQFSQEDFIKFMFKQSSAYQETINFFKEIKKRYQLKIIAVSNEGRELNAFRIQKFKLNELFDAYVSSSFVHLRKPDADIFRMAIDISQTEPKQSIYIDDRRMFVEIAQTLGLNGIHYQGLELAKKQLTTFGFSIE